MGINKSLPNFNNEKGKYDKWNQKFMLLGILFAVLLLFTAYPLDVLLQYGFNKEVFNWIGQLFVLLFTNPEGWLQAHLQWLRKIFYSSFPIPYTIIPSVAVFLGFVGWGVNSNPFDPLTSSEGSGRMARDREIDMMGLLKGNLLVLGKWKGKYLKLKETLSVLCVAPPGAGKTTAIVIPSILDTHNVTMVINDVKPELADITSGFKSIDSVVLRLEWAAQDRPEQGLFFPRWNPLSPLSMPAPGPARDLYIDRLCAIIIPDPKGDADPHWTKKGRAALTGFIHFIADKCNSGNYDGLPTDWYGKEPSIPMLLDWMTQALLNAGDEIDRLRIEDPNAALFADPVRNFLMTSVRECRERGYSNRALLELTQLANTPEKERGSIVSTMDAGMLVFKNSAVRARTSKSDFAFDDMRGIMDPKTGKFKPVTIYICVNQEDAKALGVITAMFVESLSAWLLSHKPGGIGSQGQVLGPYPVMFMLDEFPRMPKLQALIEGPALGRGMKVGYLMIGQDLGQVSSVYGKDEVETLISTTAAKIILPLNNEVTAKRFTEMIGQTSIKARSFSRTEGLSNQANPFAVNVSWNFKGVPMIRPEDLMSPPEGKHFVLIQKYMKYPILCDTPMYFKDKKLIKLVNPENGGRYEPAPPMPEWMAEKRLLEEGYVAAPSGDSAPTPTPTANLIVTRP